ncbi:outer membrane protein assembly factor BamD [Pseudofulvibacter geojedonensis]|uniref:Outer membrane protein assembly factor BamD n=1 Tax=Pseudofulvibacter geojedonensis TaxID=1123758 RepID=A0ABW3HYZ0_9FLAO
MKKLLYILTAAIFLISCSEYQKVYKNEEVAPKYALGEKLYNEGDYKRARNLFEQIVPGYAGKPGAEKLMYMYGNTMFLMEDYITSSYQLERFVKKYPRSEKIEEMSFKSAKSYYMLSPRFSLDQEDTNKAILKLQNFMNTYPKSEYFKEASDLALELDDKLQLKAYDIAKGYHHRISSGTQFRDDYYAAIAAFNNFLNDYPGSKYKEKALYYKFDTAYLLAINSTERRKEERLKDAIKYYNKWKQSAAESEFTEEAEKHIAEVNQELEKFNNQ